jgi:hypothetical protein
MKVVWMILLLAACGQFPRPTAPYAAVAAVTLRVPEDAYTIAEAIEAGATVIEVGVGEFDLGMLQLAALSYTIRGSGIERTKLRIGGVTPFTGESGSSLAFSDLTLERLGPSSMSYDKGSLSLRRSRFLGALSSNGTAVDISDSMVTGAINVTDGVLHIERSTISAGPSVPFAIEASASAGVTLEVRIRDTVLDWGQQSPLVGALRSSGAAVDISGSLVKGAISVTDGSLHIERGTISAESSALNAIEVLTSQGGTLEVKIRDTVLEGGRRGFYIRAGDGTVNASLERVAVMSSGVGVSLWCTSTGDYNVTLDHSVLFRNSIAVRTETGTANQECGQLTMRNSIFVENVVVAVEFQGRKAVAARNFSWRNTGGNYLNWRPQQPFIEVDPMFVDPERGDFRLRAGSPAIAAGAEVVDRGVRLSSVGAGELESSAKAAGPVAVGSAAAKAGRNLALVVGVQHYQDPAIKDLKYARSDAEAIARYLRTAGYTVTLLTETAASVTAVKAALINLTRAGPGDSVLVYFSVHGSGEPNPLGSGRGFLLLSDAQASSIPSTSLSVQEIQAAVDRTASERVVLIMDSCFSGGASAQAKSIWTAVNIKGDAESITGSIAYGRGKIGLFSSRDNEVSLEADEFKHGYFTYYLLEAWSRGLRGVDDVYAYVLREVASSTKGQQHPRYSSAQAEGQAPTF